MGPESDICARGTEISHKPWLMGRVRQTEWERLGTSRLTRVCRPVTPHPWPSQTMGSGRKYTLNPREFKTR